MSKWIEHVKQYQAQNGGSYRDAMKNARASYNPNSIKQEGGKFNLNRAIRKTKNTVNKVSHEVNNNIDKYGQFVPQEYQTQLKQVQGYANQAQDISGGKFNLKKAMRKTKNTVNKVSHEVNNNIDKYGQFVPQEYQGQLNQIQGYANQAQDISGGKFNMHNAMRKTKNTVKQVKNVARIAAPILSVVAPEIGLPLEAALLATGGSYRVPARGGSYRVPARGGGATRVNSIGNPHYGGSIRKHHNDDRGNYNMLDVHSQAFRGVLPPSFNGLPEAFRN